MLDLLDWIIVGLMGVCLIAGVALFWMIRSERKFVKEMRRSFKN